MPAFLAKFTDVAGVPALTTRPLSFHKAEGIPLRFAPAFIFLY